jgi:type VI secretion system protein ImpJ
MYRLQSLRWKEGMFLRPHHLQQFELSIEGRGEWRFGAGRSSNWGVIDVRVDETALADRRISVPRLQAVMAGGTLVDVPGNADIPTRPLDPNQLESGRPLVVALALRVRELRKAQTADSGAGGRFNPHLEEVHDLESGQEPQSLEFLRLAPTLLLGDEPADGFETLPLFRLVKTGRRDQPIGLDPSFAPPSLTIGAAPVLAGATGAVASRLASVLRSIDEARSGRDPAQLLLFQALCGAHPVLRQLADDPASHPREVYLELARLAGTLLFRDEARRSPDDLPAYDHREPGPAFESLRQLVVELSEPFFERRWLAIPLTRAGDNFGAALPAEAKRPGARVLINVEAVESAPRVRTIMMAARISAPARIETLSRHALPGIPTEMLTSAPAELPAGQKGTFFRLRLEESGEWLSQVAPAGELAAFLLQAPQDLKLTLYVILPAS